MKRLYLLFILVVCASTATAAESFGRLFTTPAERANLDHLRQTAKPAALKETPTEETEASTPVMPSSIAVQGYVKRGDGQKSTVWVNNQPLRENSANGEVQVGTLGKDSQIQITVPASGQNLKLKAGQVYSPDSGQIQDTVNAPSPKRNVTGEKSQSPATDSN
jgi:hypothetical protein